MIGAKKCYCNKDCIHLQVKKAGPTQGRWFWKCFRSQCKYFKWDDDPAQTSTSTARPEPAAGPSTCQSWSSHKGSLFHAKRSNVPVPRDRTSSPSNAMIEFDVHSTTRIGIKMAYNETFLPTIRSIEDATWDPQTGKWTIPATLQHYKKALDVFHAASNSHGIVVKKLPNMIETLLDVPDLQAAVNIHDADVRMNRLQNTELWQQLKNFQRIGVQKGIRRHARFLLADEMGLGKTIQALAIAYVYQETWPVLVIVPSSLRLTWKAEIQQWLDLQDEECPVIFKGSDLKTAATLPISTSEANSSDNDFQTGVSRFSGRKTMKFCIISYDLVSRNAEEITARKFKFIIADESHYIKNRAAKRTIALRPIFHQAKHVILLSGTPAFSRPVELYPQLEALRPDLFTSFHQYGLRYCAGTYQAFGWDYSGSTKLEELNFLLEKTIMVRRLKRDVDLELPKKTRQAIYMTLVPGKAKEVKCIKNEIDNLDNQIRLSDAFNRTAFLKKQRELLLTRLYVESGKAKLPSMNEYIGHLLESTTSKIIVFAYHLEVMDGIENFITQQHAKIGWMRIDGQTNQQVRRSLCEDFQSDVKVRVAILSIAAANVGLTLSAADVVVFGELFWNPSQLLQAEDRAHRIGRVGPVDIKYLLAMESIDGFQWPMVKRKLQIVGKALDGGQDKVNLDMSEKTEPEEKRHRPSHHQ